jgi:DNA-directed RNA polymerase
VEFKIQEIVWIIEETVIDYKNNKRLAVQLFRNAQCLRNDFRCYSIVSDTFNYLTYAFCKNEGQILLTNTLVKVGEIASKALGISKITKNKNIQLGSIVIEAMLSSKYLTLHREEYMTYEQLLIEGEKVKMRMQPYHLELGEQFTGVKFLIKERSGISISQYPEWTSKERMVHGIKDRLVKGNVQIESNVPKPFLSAVNNLEKVRWEINPQIAEISKLLESRLTDRGIRVSDKEGNILKFEASDIRREGSNEKYKGMNLYHNDVLFEPHIGNASQVKIIETQMIKLEKQLKRIKTNGKVRQELTRQIDKCAEVYERKNQQWLAKQLCLRKQSQANRDEFIINTIHGTEKSPGWLGFKFYLSSFLDFRGRVYARDPYFSYQSSDLARGHLMFAEKKLMTDKGYKHLLVHLANSFNQSYTVSELQELNWIESNYITDLVKDGIPDISVDKMTIQDRVNWSEEKLTMLLDIAMDPIEAIDIWMEAEKPWVFLSLCFEVVRYLAEDGDYYSQMPIAIDGASNGTQHLAAMSKDEIAGAMVGLIPKDRPVDFYIVVAKGILNRNVGNDLGQILSRIPMKLIRKGISKRGTMTKAYDAGVRCIANIIYTDCYDAGMTIKYGITRSVSSRLAKDLVDTYNSLCSGPVAVKNYLQALTKHRIKELGYKSARWETPSGFPVISEKWTTIKKKAVVSLCKKRIDAIYREVTDKPAIHEITSGISPNYVHSMDASHMSLVINKLNEAGVMSFGAIHDSFSVHADDVDLLLTTTKSVFITMYDCDIFADMNAQFIGCDKNFEVEEPKVGSLDLSKIKESQYFFC